MKRSTSRSRRAKATRAVKIELTLPSSDHNVGTTETPPRWVFDLNRTHPLLSRPPPGFDRCVEAIIEIDPDALPIDKRLDDEHKEGKDRRHLQ